MAQLKSTHVMGNISANGNVIASQFIKFGGTNNQILLAGGDVVAKDSFAPASLVDTVTGISNRLINSSTDNSVVRFDEAQGKIQTSPTTIADNGSMRINNAAQNDIYFEMARGENADWRFLSSSGNLYIQNNWAAKKGDYFNVLTLTFNDGNGSLKGSFTAGSFIKSGGTATQILLANGGTTS